MALICTVGDSKCQSLCRGIRCEETGICVTRYRQRTEVDREFCQDEDGCDTGFTEYNPRQSATLTGRISTAISAIMGASFCSSLTVCNFYDGYGVSQGGIYLDNIETTESLNDWCEATLAFFRRPLIN